MKLNYLAHLFLLAANLIYALNYTIAKDIMPYYIQPSGFIFLRVLGGCLLFFILYSIKIKEKVLKKDLFLFSICGLLGVATNQLFFFNGLNLTTPINAAIIMTITPIIVIIFSSIVLKEKIISQKILGVVFGLTGACVLILNEGRISLNNSYMIGNIFILINATSYALYLVLVKPLMERYNPITVMTYIFSFGLVFVMPFGINEFNSIDWSIFSDVIIIKVIYVVVFTTFFAYLLNAFALKKLSPSSVSIYIYLQPLLASLIAILLKSDSINSVKIIATIFIFLGVFLSSSRENKNSPKLS